MCVLWVIGNQSSVLASLGQPDAKITLPAISPQISSVGLAILAEFCACLIAQTSIEAVSSALMNKRNAIRDSSFLPVDVYILCQKWPCHWLSTYSIKGGFFKNSVKSITRERLSQRIVLLTGECHWSRLTRSETFTFPLGDWKSCELPNWLLSSDYLVQLQIVQQVGVILFLLGRQKLKVAWRH